MKIRKEIKIGIFLLLTLLVFIWGYSFLKGKNLLKPVGTYYVVYEQIGGLKESAPVIVSGHQIGLVSDIRFLPDNRNINVTLLIDRNFRIPLNSVAMIYSADLMGTKAIELVLSANQEFHNSEDVLLDDIEPDLKEEINMQLAPLRLKAEELMGSIDSVMVIIQAVLNDNFQRTFTTSFQNISNTINSMASSMHAIDTILNDDRSNFSRIMANLESIISNLKNSNNEINHIFSNIGAITDSLAKANIHTTISNLNQSLAKTNEILYKINKGEGTAGALINNPELYDNLANASASLDNLLSDFRENPGRYVSVSLINFGRRDKKIKSDTLQKANQN